MSSSGDGGAHAALVERARRAGQVIAPLSARIEAERRLPPEAVGALVEAGVFKLLVPASLGGAEASLGTFLAVLEAIGHADGSAGWCAMIGASSGLMSGFLDPDVARRVYGPPDAVTCGVFAPFGRAVPVDGGYRVSGRWPFASGCQHSQWRMGGAKVEGQDEVRHMLFSADEARVVDTWDASGLRGTGSHDLEVSEVFVPASRSFSLLADRPRESSAIFALPFYGVLASGIAAVALGIARASVDALVALAGAKQPQGSRRSLAHREGIQLAVARAEAKLAAGRAFLDDAAARAVAETEQDGAASVQARARLRLAASHAVTESAAAVDLMYEAGGGTSVYARHPLQRHFRDIHVATQHIMVGPASTSLAGRVLLGLDTDVAML